VKANQVTSVEVKPNPKAGIGSIPKSVSARLGNVEKLTQAILWVGLIALVAIIVSVGGMVIDQMHFNNQSYRDQSQKTELMMQEINTRIDQIQQEIKNNTPKSGG
jgi:hypothetical protein